MTRPTLRPTPRASGRSPFRRLAALTAGALVAGGGVFTPTAAFAAGTTLSVNADPAVCSATGPGTTGAAPFCTISAAVKAATPGDTVSVAAGTYKERVDVTKTLSILGQSGATVDATGLLYGFKLSAADVQLSGFSVQGGTTASVFLSATTNVTVRNVSTTGGGNGVYVQDGSGNTLDQVAVNGGSAVGILLRTTSHNTVSSSTTTGNKNHGLSIQGGDGNVVSGVTSSANSKGDRSATGIDVRGFTPNGGALVSATNTTIEGSTTYGNEDSGIEIYPDSSATTVRRNVTYDNGDHGIDVAGAPNTTIVSNTIVGNINVGLNVEASGAGVGSTGATLRDNISAENGINPSVNPTTGATGSPGEIRVDGASTSGTTLDRDLMWRSSAGPLFAFGTSFASDLAGVKATGQEANGLVADPRFVSLSGRDLHLTAASPAVDAAFADVPGWRNADRDGNAPVDQGAVANTGTGTPPFADIGAYELTGGAPPPPPPPPTAPTASLTATPNQATTGSPVTLDASGSKATAQGATLTYKFDCGAKGVTPVPDASSSAKATCTYTAANTYNPSVTVTDSNNQTATATAQVRVDAPPPAPAPTASLTAKPSSLTTGGSSTLDATGSTGAITDYAFDCANGTAVTHGTATTRVCTYTRAGSYVAKVTVTDSNKQTASATATVTVTDPTTGGGGGGGGGGTPPPPPPPPPSPTAPAADLTATPAQVVAGGTSTLDGSGSKATASGATLTGYRFDCGNGAAAVTGVATSTRCTYPKAGSYTATLTVTDSNGKSDSAATTVTVTAPAPTPAPPHARLSLVMKRLAHGHLRVRLDASASTGSPGAPLVAFKFYCGNGHHTTWLQRNSVACVYRHHGRYLVKVKVKNSLGMVDTVTRVVRFRRH